MNFLPALFHFSLRTTARSFGRLSRDRMNVLLSLTLILLCSTFLFFYRLADRDLWSSHEARAAQNAQTILRTGEWGLPALFDGHPEMQKPPLYYWLVALTAKVRGVPVDAWAVRLPAALAGLMAVLGVWAMLVYLGRPVAGLIAGLILATAAHFTWLAHVGRIDMPLTFAVSVTLGCFYVARKQRETGQQNGISGFHWAGFLAIAAAIMLKGPIGVLLPMAALLFDALSIAALRREWRRIPPEFWSSLLWGLPLVLLLTVPWFWWVNRHTHGEFFRVFFWHHNLERGLGSADDLKVHPWWFYGPQLLLDFLPWSPLLLVAGWYLLRNGRWREDAEARFGMVWLLAVMLLLSCSSFKRSDYLLPAYPGAAILLGCVGERWFRAVVLPRRLAIGFGVVIAGCLLTWGAILGYLLPQEEPAREQRSFAAAVRQHTSTGVLFFRAEEHLLAFHLGYPLSTFVEWENLNIWAGTPGTYYILMPPECAAEWQKHVTAGRLEEVIRNTELTPGIPPHEQLVLMRTIGQSASER